jgi:hypothetical protein
MWTLADRLAKTVSDFTVGTVIVLAHVTLANREINRRRSQKAGRTLERADLPRSFAGRGS